MNVPMTGKLRPAAVALALILGSLSGRSAIGQVGGPAPSRTHKWDGLFHKRKAASQGTLGYGPPGVFPGFQGFGLGYHPGYGYGGQALGVGAEGGYPLYGGPGYPHPAPVLQRIGGIAPFCYYGGPGGPTPGHPNFFDGVGPLVPDQPVVTIPPDSPFAGDYGPFTGSLPYPESTFAPFTTRAGGDSSSGSSPSEAPSRPQPPTPSTSPTTATTEAIPGSPDARSLLGIDTDAVVDAGSARGLKVTWVQPSSAGERAGLKVGDVIRSANGYLTEQPGHLTWVLLKAAADGVITLDVLAAQGGEVHVITVRRP
jgi:membrane-associated protease RseP (regulator of RpoE activity)